MIGGSALVGFFTNQNPWKFAGLGVVLLVVMVVTLATLLFTLKSKTGEKIFNRILWLNKWFLVIIMPYWLYLIITSSIKKAF